MWKRTIFIVLAVTIVATACISLRTQAVIDKPTPDFLVAAIKDQAAKVKNSVDVSYTFTPAETPERVLRFRYVRTNDFLYAEQERDGKIVARESFDRQAQEFRQLDFLRNDETSGLISNRIQGRLGNLMVFDPVVRQGVDGKTLAEAVRSGVVAPERELIHGSFCWRVDIPANKDAGFIQKEIVWLDPAIGFCPRQITTHHTEIYSSVPTIVEFLGYEDIGDGVWFPDKIQITAHIFGENRSGTSVARKSALHLDNSISPDELKIVFPSGAKIQDQIRDAYYTVP